MSKFKAGDRVVCVDDKDIINKNTIGLQKGETYIVSSVAESVYLRMLNGKESEGYFSSRFELVEEKLFPCKIKVTAENCGDVQEWLLSKGAKWLFSGQKVIDHPLYYIFVSEAGIMINDNSIVGFENDSRKEVVLEVKKEYSYTIVEKKPETVEFNGNLYNKEDLEKALSLLELIKK